MMEGIVIKSIGSSYMLMCDDGKHYECRLKGNFKIKGLKSTNPIAVGDRVQFDFAGDNSVGSINYIEDRKNYIIRKSINLSKRQHIIASNIDQAVIIGTLAFPRTSTGFIDRFLVVCEQYHIPASIVFNKIDLYPDDYLKYLEELKTLYSAIGYTCLETSATEKKGLEEFKNLLQNKTNLLAGHSGVGKSALINAIDPSLKIKIGEISSAHLKGKHTTTFAEMHPLKFGGFIIDTPGIKELGMVNVKPEEIGGYFPEMRALLPKCRFYNCTHIHEPDCAVIKALNQGEINADRYHNYVGMLNDDGIEKGRDWKK